MAIRSFTAFDALGRLTPQSVTGVGDRTVQHRAYSDRADGNQIGRFMPTQTVDAMKALSRFGELAWFKLPTEYNDEYGYHQVAYMGWRYKAPREGVDQFVEDVVKDVSTQLAWVLDRTRRNRILLPNRVLLEAGGLGNPAFADVVHSVNTRDQEFCIASISDLALIVQHLQRVPVP
ncbi:hypothetical protein ACF1GY_02565 [Streptomyces sp. NPDC014684]|uniref:hypothetical protein n=1 Tax=Streptomyces sp. NPDC014684 TaxID=3364880 RepID=UPI0036F8E89C